jgi:hypothetical protein
MKYELYAGLEDVYQKGFRYGTKTGFISASTILKFVSEKNNISIAALRNPSRKREIVQIRQQYVWLFRALLVKRGVMDSMCFKRSAKVPKNVSNNNEVMSLIGKSHCLAEHCWESYENLFLTNKPLEKKSKEMLEELDKLIV